VIVSTIPIDRFESLFQGALRGFTPTVTLEDGKLSVTVPEEFRSDFNIPKGEPKHLDLPNVAECELAVLASQCLARVGGCGDVAEQPFDVDHLLQQLAAVFEFVARNAGNAPNGSRNVWCREW
jgi:hypothetical protein